MVARFCQTDFLILELDLTYEFKYSEKNCFYEFFDRPPRFLLYFLTPFEVAFRLCPSIGVLAATMFGVD